MCPLTGDYIVGLQNAVYASFSVLVSVFPTIKLLRNTNVMLKSYQFHYRPIYPSLAPFLYAAAKGNCQGDDWRRDSVRKERNQQWEFRG